MRVVEIYILRVVADQKTTIWEQFLQPVLGFFIDEQELKQLSETIDWDGECDRLSDPDLVYPEYYQSQNFHGVKNGYLSSSAAVTYDAVTQYVLPPNETWIRQEAIEVIGGSPRRILDLGCGTGSTTLLLKQAFSDAEITGLDLSPYMLAIASYKAQENKAQQNPAQKQNQTINWRHGRAEATGLEPASFDLVTASLLFHETPTEITQQILEECFRLLVPGGQVVILDGNQKTLRQTPWLNNIFEEPYINQYAEGNLDGWLGAAGFDAIRTQDIWWTNQVSYALKPRPISDRGQNPELEFDFPVVPV